MVAAGRAAVIVIISSITTLCGPAAHAAASRHHVSALLRTRMRAYVRQNGTAGKMPTIVQLRSSGCAALQREIRAAGGQTVVAEALGLRMARPAGRKPTACMPPDDERRSRVAAALLEYIEQHGEPGVMPALDTLAAAGRHDILWGVRREFGGLRAAMRTLELRAPRARPRARGKTARPRGYWLDFSTVERELHAFIAANGTAGLMPSQLELRTHGRHDVSNAITAHHGGINAVASRLGLARPTARTPRGLLADARRFERELQAFIAANGTAGVMPTQAELQEHGRYDLSHAIAAHHGGRLPLARALNLRYVETRPRQPRGYYEDWPSVRAELLAHIATHGTSGVMPSRLELIASGKRKLLSAIERARGSLGAAAAELGLQEPAGERFGVWVIDTGALSSSGERLVRGSWQRQVATVDPESLVARSSTRRRVSGAPPQVVPPKPPAGAVPIAATSSSAPRQAFDPAASAPSLPPPPLALPSTESGPPQAGSVAVRSGQQRHDGQLPAGVARRRVSPPPPSSPSSKSSAQIVLRTGHRGQHSGSTTAR